jgi:hypothetical protein
MPKKNTKSTPFPEEKTFGAFVPHGSTTPTGGTPKVDPEFGTTNNFSLVKEDKGLEGPALPSRDPLAEQSDPFPAQAKPSGDIDLDKLSGSKLKR